MTAIVCVRRALPRATTLTLLILNLLAGAWSFQAAAAEPAPVQGPPGEAFAYVSRLRGEVSAEASGHTRILREGDAVHVGERLKATPTGEAVLRTVDAGAIAMRPNVEFVAENYSAKGKAGDSFTLRLVTGSLRLISGWIARLNRPGVQVTTPTATIGIRGTDHEPYVLTKEKAAGTTYREGTYDKVNRGGTTLDAGGQSVDIDPGRVGFAPAPKPYRTRALMTLLLPVLLDKIPDFYVPGEFDAELDRYSGQAEAESQRLLGQKRMEADREAASCPAEPIARAWLARLDEGIARRDTKAILALFANDVVVLATVRGEGGKPTTLEMGREELVQSTLEAIAALTQYEQRRISIEAGKSAGAGCDLIRVKSVVIEQGNQAGKRYRFESVEEYELQLRNGEWQAVRAETTQQ